ncbi:MAG: helix-turn-helix transcriptional regulator, partial [bacterium]|nr:helix-turn-helix transcriptional regulator [bacterium]MDW8163842.1 helix-turn-helix transcriptional regulator [Candidatus Omnitrophota bacterium]
MIINKLLKRKREELGLTIKDIAKFCGMSPSLVCMIEKGKANPDIKFLYFISHILDLPFFYLINLLWEETKNEKVKEEIAKIRFRETYPLLFPSLPKESLSEMILFLKEKYPDRFEHLYKKAIEKYPKFQDMEKETVLAKYFKEQPSIKEIIYRNMYSKEEFFIDNLPPEEKLKQLKETFGFKWDVLSKIFKKSERSLQRYVAGKIKVPKKLANKIDRVYERMFSRIGSILKSVAPETIFRKIEEIGLTDEIKDRLINKYPSLKRFKNKPLPVFFYELSKYESVNEILEKNLSDSYLSLSPRERRIASDGLDLPLKKKNKLNKVKNKENGNPKVKIITENTRPKIILENERQRNNGKSNTESSDSSESDDDSDDYYFKIIKKRFKINEIVEMIFDNLGQEKDLPKRRVHMKLTK